MKITSGVRLLSLGLLALSMSACSSLLGTTTYVDPAVFDTVDPPPEVIDSGPRRDATVHPDAQELHFRGVPLGISWEEGLRLFTEDLGEPAAVDEEQLTLRWDDVPVLQYGATVELLFHRRLGLGLAEYMFVPNYDPNDLIIDFYDLGSRLEAIYGEADNKNPEWLREDKNHYDLDNALRDGYVAYAWAWDFDEADIKLRLSRTKGQYSLIIGYRLHAAWEAWNSQEESGL